MAGAGIQPHFQAGLVGFEDSLLAVGGVSPGKEKDYPLIQTHAGELRFYAGLPVLAVHQ